MKTYIKKNENSGALAYISFVDVLAILKSRKRNSTTHSPQEGHRQDNHQKVETKKESSPQYTTLALCFVPQRSFSPNTLLTQQEEHPLLRIALHTISQHTFCFGPGLGKDINPAGSTPASCGKSKRTQAFFSSQSPFFLVILSAGLASRLK